MRTAVVVVMMLFWCCCFSSRTDERDGMRVVVVIEGKVDKKVVLGADFDC